MTKFRFMYLLGKSKMLYNGKVRSVRYVKFVKLLKKVTTKQR